MARPRATTQFNFRVPNPLYAAVSTWATECEWAVNSELTAAVQFWARQAPEVRAEQRGRTKEAPQTEAGRGYQKMTGKYAKAAP